MNLSSSYLRESSKEDSFTYESILIESRDSYRFAVYSTSVVDFISMPFAIRIMGDATIISLLHRGGYEKKDFSVWGRKVMMDCFDQVKSNGIMEFTISLSEMVQKEDSTVLVSRFRTSCGKCAGSFVISFENGSVK